MGTGKAVYKHTACDSFRAGRHCHYNDDDCARSKKRGQDADNGIPELLEQPAKCD